MTHRLKTWPIYFNLILRGKKKFEVRKNDRKFKVGDKLKLLEFRPKTSSYTGRIIEARIDYITSFGQPKGQVVMSITPYSQPERYTNL